MAGVLPRPFWMRYGTSSALGGIFLPGSPEKACHCVSLRVGPGVYLIQLYWQLTFSKRAKPCHCVSVGVAPPPPSLLEGREGGGRGGGIGGRGRGGNGAGSLTLAISSWSAQAATMPTTIEKIPGVERIATMPSIVCPDCSVT